MQHPTEYSFIVDYDRPEQCPQLVQNSFVGCAKKDKCFMKVRTVDYDGNGMMTFQVKSRCDELTTRIMVNDMLMNKSDIKFKSFFMSKVIGSGTRGNVVSEM